ncbi:MAG: hypothetical protein DI592_09385, partial [Stenotrophomonas maltophilia]
MRRAQIPTSKTKRAKRRSTAASHFSTTCGLKRGPSSWSACSRPPTLGSHRKAGLGPMPNARLVR